MAFIMVLYYYIKGVIMVKIPAELKELAQIFKDNKATLYIVGGYVRDSYLGVSSQIRDDIDLCSNIVPKKLRKILEGTKFEVKNINESVGVMAIFGKRRYEYATFRKEVYDDDSHTPDSVEFINSLEEDSKRRDFKINAIYFDILEGSYVDPLGGIDDLRSREITTVKSPKIVFNDDPERILRLVRFACSLGLNIPEEEMFYAKQNSYKIKFISQTRLRNEFERLLTVDEVYPELLYTREAHFRAMLILGELDAWKWILPAIDEIMKINISDFKGEKIYDHILNCLKNSSPKIRLAVLLHDVGKFKSMEIQKNFFGSKEWVGVIVEKNLGMNGLGYPKNIVENVKKIILGYDFNNRCLASKRAIRKFIFENDEVIENIIEIKNVVKNESKKYIKNVRSASILRKNYNEMIKLNIPFRVEDLAIKGDEIIKSFPKIKLENLGTLLDNILLYIALHLKNNSKETLLKVATKLINSKRDFYLEK